MTTSLSCLVWSSLDLSDSPLKSEKIMIDLFSVKLNEIQGSSQTESKIGPVLSESNGEMKMASHLHFGFTSSWLHSKLSHAKLSFLISKL